MNASEESCLNQDDIRLFHHGACHVFATALLNSLPDEGYTLKRVVLKKMSHTNEAYHVFAAVDGFLVDASGIKREEDFAAWLTARQITKIFERSFMPTIGLYDVTADELLAHHHDDACRNTVNQWNLFTGEAFVAKARERANALIEHWPEKYRVSVLRAGLGLPKETEG